MFKRVKIKILFTVFILFSVLRSAESQALREVTYLTFEQVTSQLETRYGVRFFFKPEWFEMRRFNSSILSRPFIETLERIKSETDYSIFTIDSVLYIFVPLKPELKPAAEPRNPDEIVIGNPDDFGKVTKATIQGTIVDGMNGDPLPGASVFIDRLMLGVMTDNKGNYRIKAPVGDYTVRLSYIGYDEITQKIRLVNDGSLNLELYEKAIKLGEVVISAERPDKNVSGTQMSYVKLDSKSIKELPVSMGVTDIIKSITLVPGVQTVGEFGTGFNVRGGRADQNLILLEDVPLFNSSHLFGMTSVVNADGISEVTLFKAGIPARYGERASSVMDIKFGAENKDITTVKGGIGLIDSRLYIETPLKSEKLTLLASVRSSYSNWLLHQMPDIDLKNSSAHFYDANFLLSYDHSPVNKLSVFAYLSNDRFSFTKNSDYKYGNLLASVKWKHFFSENLWLNMSAGMSNYKFALTESDSSRAGEAYKINSLLTYKNLKMSFSWFPLENHSVDFGLNSILYSIKPGEIEPLKSESVIEQVTIQQEKALENALYISDIINIGEKLMIDMGLRYSHYSYLGPNKVYFFDPDLPKSRGSITDSIQYGRNKVIGTYSGLEPRFSVRYSISDKSSLKFSYNRIHQYINLVSNTAVMTPSDVWKLSSPNLRPLRSDHLALGYFRNFKNNIVETSIEIYYKKLQNATDYKNGAKILLNPYPEADLLSVSGNNYGVELFVRINSGKLTGWLSYTYSRSLQKTAGIFDIEKINNNQFFPSDFDRPDNLIVNFNYHLSRRWRFGGTFTYCTGRPVTLPEYKYTFQGYQLIHYSDRNKYRLPDYHRLDVSITYDKNLKIKKSYKGSWTLSIVNLYGRKNAYSAFYKKEEHMVSTEYRQYDTYMLYIIGIPFPSLTYNFSF